MNVTNAVNILWNAYLKADTEAVEILQSNDLSEASGGVVELSRR